MRHFPVLLVLAFAVLSAPAGAATFTVTTTADSGPGSLRAALADAVATTDVEDTIEVPAGTYAISSPLVVNDSPGRLIVVEGAGARSTTIDADGSGRVLAVGVTTRLDVSGVSIVGGEVRSASAMAPAYGGGALVDGELRLFGVSMRGNVAEDGGGAIAVQAGGDLFVSRSTLSGNRASSAADPATAGGQGGAIRTLGYAELQMSTVSGNTAGAGPGGAVGTGGAVNVRSGGTLETNAVTFQSNSAAGVGASGGHVFVETGGNVYRLTTAFGTASPNGCNVQTSSNSSGDQSLSADETCVVDNDVPDPVLALGPLADNGGPTDTHLPAPSSDLRDAAEGCNLFSPGPVDPGDTESPFDQTARARPFGPKCDIGSVEFRPAPATGNGNGDAPPPGSQGPPVAPPVLVTPGPGAQLPPLAPVTGLAVSPTTFRAMTSGGPIAATPTRSRSRRRGATGGTTVRFASLGRPVRFAVERLVAGRRVNGRCVARTRRNTRRSRCERVLSGAATFVRTPTTTGTDRFRFTGRIGGRALPAGRYRLVAQVVSGGQVSAARRTPFRILPPPRARRTRR